MTAKITIIKVAHTLFHVLLDGISRSQNFSHFDRRDTHGSDSHSKIHVFLELEGLWKFVNQAGRSDASDHHLTHT